MSVSQLLVVYSAKQKKRPAANSGTGIHTKSYIKIPVSIPT